ncbi:hypothetical protein [Haloarchaeobius sp. TZWWS8]|uniref:hypothetical protein n=1 Tax=Haloarchaeobius sp. TZWWS8 TaxID=3446121 RepID=UPI003EBD2FAE
MSDLIGHLLGFRKLIGLVVGSGLCLAALLSTVALNETGTLLVYLLVGFVVVCGAIGYIYLRIITKESESVRDPPSNWERER